MIAAALAVALALGAPPLPKIPDDAVIKTYVVQPGDSAWSIAAEFYGSGDYYPIIYKYNGFAARPPFLLTPGQTLYLPVLERGPEAQIAWLRHDVRAKPPRSLDWLSAREDMNLWRLYRVSTGDASAARIVFDDTSDLRLREEALLVIYGASATAAKMERDKKQVRLEEGTLTGGLAKLDADARPIEVETPAADVQILGRLVQIQADALASMVSAYDGSARVTARGETVVVPAGQGTVVKKGQRPAAPRPLPPAPAWSDGLGPALAVALPGGPAASWEAAWTPVREAETYRVEVAADPSFKEVLFDTEVGKGVTRLRLADLGLGTWVVRVSTRDAQRLESVPGPPRVVTVALASASRRLVPEPDALVAVGLLELVAPTGLTVALDADGPPAARVTVPSGRHTITWRSSGEHAASTTTRVEVVPVTGALELACAPDGGGCTSVSVAVVDARGRPAPVPGLVIESSAGPLVMTVDGARATAALTPTPGQAQRVRARWAGGVLDARDVLPSSAPEAHAPPAPRRAMLPDRPRRGWARPHLAPHPTDALGVEVGVAATDPEALDVMLRGELAWGPLGFDAGLAFSEVTLGDEVEAAVGDLWLGARGRVEAGPLALVPTLGVSLPVGAGLTPRVTTLEPGLHLAVSASADVTFELRASGVLRLGDAPHDTGVDGVVVAGLGPIALSWRARLEGGTLDHTLGLGFARGFGPVRLGIALGYEPRDAAWSARLAIDATLD